MRLVVNIQYRFVPVDSVQKVDFPESELFEKRTIEMFEEHHHWNTA